MLIYGSLKFNLEVTKSCNEVFNKQNKSNPFEFLKNSIQLEKYA